MIRVISLNLNGIRSAAKKGFFKWMLKQNADVICLQELKAQEPDLQHEVYRPAGYDCYYNYAIKKGYSGVALYAKQKPQNIITNLGWQDADEEGRYLEADFGKLKIISLYMPSGSSGEHRQKIKFDFLTRFSAHLSYLKEQQCDYIICGDWNIAHRQIDLKNWRSNQKHSGFLPEERAWMEELFGPLGFCDAFRLVNQEPDQYTWWSNRGQAWKKNVGWRIDYQVITPGLKPAVRAVSIYKEERFSDHAPLIIDYELNIS